MALHDIAVRSFAIAALIGLGACGGGGGGGDSAAAAAATTEPGGGNSSSADPNGNTSAAPGTGTGTGSNAGAGTGAGGDTAQSGTAGQGGSGGGTSGSGSGAGNDAGGGNSGNSGNTATTGGTSGAGSAGSGGTAGSGGAGSQGGGSTGSGGNDVIATTGTLQQTVSVATYANGSLADGAYSTLNEVRQWAGVGLLQQSTQLDTAASAHAGYLSANTGAVIDRSGHAEVAGRPAFYDTTPLARIARAGFTAGYWAEAINSAGTVLGADCTKQMLDTVYQALALLGPATHVGFGFGRTFAATPLCVANLATQSGDAFGQVGPSGSLMAYPYPSEHDVSPLIKTNFDWPRLPLALFPDEVTGKPVIFGLRNADYLNFAAAGSLNVVITRFELTDPDGNVVPAAILANASIRGDGIVVNADPNLPEGVAVLVPYQPLRSFTQYTVAFTATLKTGGVPMDHSWSFFTGR